MTIDYFFMESFLYLLPVYLL